MIAVSEEVRAALADGGGVVALETSVIAQGLPSPTNREVAVSLDRAVREAGAVPAWVAIDGGRVRVGLDRRTLERLAEPGAAVKVARRDVPIAVASGALGGTTVSATLWAAAAAGVSVSATGGIGGVHPGSNDVSADLLELARTPGMLVCSGPKSIVDPLATVERLEELGVAVVGYGVRRLPFFLTRAAPVELEHVVHDPAEAASILATARDLATPSTIVLCNPIPAEEALDPSVVSEAVERALARADAVRGKDLTPYLLAAVAEETGGRSLRANAALLEANASVAGRVAASLSDLDRRGS
jgi:pseudouridine-5'-phosphate glycosidase